MIDNIQSAADVVKVRLTLNVAYILNGEPSAEMAARLRRMCEHAIGNGMLTGETAAEVDEYAIDVSIPPAPLSEPEIADFMRQRIEGGNLSAEDMPVRLARYGLMEADHFISEMRERMEMMSDEAHMDPILSSLSPDALRFVEDQLSNDESSPDHELFEHFVINGLTDEQARQAMTYRARYLGNIYLNGFTPIRKGAHARRYNPHSGRFEPV
jgi:hypothetical protein